TTAARPPSTSPTASTARRMVYSAQSRCNKLGYRRRRIQIWHTSEAAACAAASGDAISDWGDKHSSADRSGQFEKERWAGTLKFHVPSVFLVQRGPPSPAGRLPAVDAVPILQRVAVVITGSLRRLIALLGRRLRPLRLGQSGGNDHHRK